MNAPVKIAKKSISAIADALKWLYDFLAKGTSNIVKMIDQMFIALRKTEKVASEVHLPAAEKRWKEKQRKIQEAIDKKKNGGYLTDTDEEIFRKAQKGQGGGQRYRRSTLRQIAKEIEKKYADISLKVEIVKKRSHPERYKKWAGYGTETLASCNTRKIPPTMYLRDDATELTIQHEMWHIDDFRKLGYEKYNSLPDWKLEEMVWEKVWKQKHRWTQEEIIDSYKYYKRECGEQGAEYKKIEELEKLIK